MRKLFNEENGLLLLDEVVQQTDSFRSIISDGQITDDEVIAQVNKVLILLKKMEQQLSPEHYELSVDTIAELAVLFQINYMRESKNNGNV